MEGFLDNLEDNSWPYQFIVGTKFTTFINNIPDAVIISDEPGNIINANGVAIDMLGYSKQKLLSMQIEELVPESAIDHKALRKAYFKNPTPRILGKRNLNLDVVANHNVIIPMDATLFCLETDKGLVAINIIRDISSKKAREEALVQQALYDQLTKLPNRHYLNEMYKTFSNIAKRMQLKTALLLIDLDEFKPINDTYGHHVGDKILQRASSTLTNIARKNDFAVRLGGDEFLFLALIDDIQDAKDIAQRVLDTLNHPFKFDGKTFSIKASIGICVSDDPNTDISKLTQVADANMYQAKENGRNQWHFSE